MLGDQVISALRNINELGPTLEALVEEMRVLRELIEEMRLTRDQLSEVTDALRDTTGRLDRANELAEAAVEQAEGAG